MGGFQEAVLYVLKVILVDKHTPQTNFDPFGLLELVVFCFVGVTN